MQVFEFLSDFLAILYQITLPNGRAVDHFAKGVYSIDFLLLFSFGLFFLNICLYLRTQNW